MSIKASPEAIRDMKKTLNKTVKSIQKVKQSIEGATSKSKDWDDEQGRQYHELMKRIAQLTESPSDTLTSAEPKLENLAQALEAYIKVKF